MQKYFLDPDNNAIKNDKKIRCCRCQKVINNTENAIKGFVTQEEGPEYFCPAINGNKFLGKDCFEIIKKEGN